MLRRIAVETDRERPHEVMLEALDLVLLKYGKPTISAIDAAREEMAQQPLRRRA